MQINCPWPLTTWRKRLCAWLFSAIPAQAQWLAGALYFTLHLALFSVIPALAQEVQPDFYREPGIYPHRNYIRPSANEHIDPFTGALQLHYVDIHLPGNGGFDLNVVRSYNSASNSKQSSPEENDHESF